MAGVQAAGALRSWYRITVEFPEWRRDLEMKWAYLTCWRLLRD